MNLNLIRRAILALGFTVLPLGMLAISEAPPAAAFSDTVHAAIEDGHCILWIDPPFQIPVTFTGTIGRNVLNRVGGYAADAPHKALVDVTDLYDPGPQDVVATATAPYLGTSVTVRFTFTCKPEEPTTTTSTSTSSTSTTSTTVLASTSTSTSTTVAASTTTGAPPSTATPTTFLGIAANISSLPFTGSSSGPIAAFGISCVVGGAFAVVKTRRKSREVKVGRKLLQR